MRSQLRTPILAVLFHLPLDWNTYLLFNSDIVNFVWKTNERCRGEGGMRAESIVLIIFVLWRCFNLRWVKGCGVGQTFLFRSNWNPIFFQPGFKPTKKAWFILACCIEWIFLRFIFMSHCCFRFSSLGNW